METCEIETCVRGHHVYKSIWSPTTGEELDCRREPSNAEDPYAVAVVRRSTVVGHVPRKISAACSLFLRREGTIRCRITASRRFSDDLPQGGLEVPCILIFRGESKDVAKMRKLLVPVSMKDTTAPGAENEPPNKRKKINSDIIEVDKLVLLDTSPSRWLSLKGIDLTEMDKTRITSGRELSDNHINFAQEILKIQFPHISGLQSTLILAKYQKVPLTSTYLQIIHSRGNHWIVATNLGCAPKLQMFDSLYSSVDEATTEFLRNLFGPCVIEVGESPMQDGTTDCGLYAIATCVALASNQKPGQFIQKNMRVHLVKCFENRLLTLFPC